MTIYDFSNNITYQLYTRMKMYMKGIEKVILEFHYYHLKILLTHYV